ncbi:MAG: diacylglycerol kinase [Clostridium sp. 27_14]|nr:MAG: diacylglycerol kinase [Clostridium sp. 27_14]
MMKNKKLINSFKCAIQGIKQAVKTERNVKIHITIMILVIIAGIVLKINTQEWIICIILFGLVISLELVNSAIEATVDIAMPEINEKAKVAKDVAAGAVLVSAIASAIIGLIIFIPKVIAFCTNMQILKNIY